MSEERIVISKKWHRTAKGVRPAASYQGAESGVCCKPSLSSEWSLHREGATIAVASGLGRWGTCQHRSGVGNAPGPGIRRRHASEAAFW